MAEPSDAYPASATKGGRERAQGKGAAALREALDVHGEELAAAIERTDEASDVVDTALLMIAAADEADAEYVAESTANLVRAADGLSTEGAAALATDVGESGDELAEALALVLELQRDGHLGELVELAKTLSAIEVDGETVAGLNTALGALGEAERESEPVGLLGFVNGLRSADARAGLGYLLTLLRAQGRRLRRE